ncbi:MAG: OmpA family protein, partial [Bacteroidetes bacterium]|nr:OmpA family protein [Bacteroidota bacterium]
TELSRLIRDNKNLMVEISGYTDTRGSEPFNDTLSIRRATSVLEILTACGMKKERAIINGFGERRTGKEKNDQESANNRRADITVVEVKTFNYDQDSRLLNEKTEYAK